MEKRINREYKSTLFVLVFGNRKEKPAGFSQRGERNGVQGPGGDRIYHARQRQGLFRPPEERPFLPH